MPFLEPELTRRVIRLNPGKTVVLTPKGHVPTPEEILLSAGVGVRITDEAGIKVVGVPVGTDEFENRERHRDRARWGGGGKTLAGAATNAG